MPQITNTRIKQVIEALDKSYFTVASFSVNFPDQGNKLVVISFLDNEKFIFNLSVNYQDVFTANYTLGDVKTTTQVEFEDFDKGFSFIKTWAENIKDELIASNPFYDELQNLKDEFNEKLNQHIKDPKQHFSKQETEELNAKLDDLEKKFEQLKEEQVITTQELRAAQKTLEELKNDLTQLPKKTWYRTAGNKIIEIAAKAIKSEQGRKLLEKVSEKLLDSSKLLGN
jgi:hypothetical protein